MMRVVAALALLAVLATSALAGWRETFNTWERGYITAAVPAEIAPQCSVDITPPIIGTDTLNVRGFMIGMSGAVVNANQAIFIRYREAGDDGWYRWNQWLESRLNYGLPVIVDGTYGAGKKNAALSSFIPISNIRLLRLFNPNSATSASTVTIWFIDQQDAKTADWSTWDMPNEFKGQF